MFFVELENAQKKNWFLGIDEDFSFDEIIEEAIHRKG